MSEADGFRARLAAAGADVPDAIVPVVAVMAQPLLDALDALTTLDTATLEPFDPAVRLVADADP